MTNNLFRTNKSYEKEEVIKQIIAGNAVHNILMKYQMNNLTRIDSTIGKKIENIKVEIKRSREDIKYRYNKSQKNICDNFLLQYGEVIISRAEEAINFLGYIDYLSLIERSMKKNEICLGRIDEVNLRVMENIEIATVKNISYNLVEEDIYEYLRRIKRKSNEFNFIEVINEYINIANLNNESKNYIEILLCIPYDSLRQWRKYRYDKKNLSEVEYLNNIKRAFNYEIN